MNKRPTSPFVERDVGDEEVLGRHEVGVAQYFELVEKLPQHFGDRLGSQSLQGLIGLKCSQERGLINFSVIFRVFYLQPRLAFKQIILDISAL